MARSRFIIGIGCATTKHPLIGTFILEGGAWNLTATRLREGGVDVPARGPDIAGTFGISAEYAGCASCRASSYVKCSSCEKLACWNPATSHFTCPSCGNGGPVGGSITAAKAID